MCMHHAMDRRVTSGQRLECVMVQGTWSCNGWTEKRKEERKAEAATRGGRLSESEWKGASCRDVRINGIATCCDEGIYKIWDGERVSCVGLPKLKPPAVSSSPYSSAFSRTIT